MSDAVRRRRLPQLVRWLHIYLSMVAFAATLLFAVTGLTLNHAEWFEGGEPAVRIVEGSLPPTGLAGAVDRLAVAEELRARHGIRGRVAEFAVEDEECLVLWKGPGYSADVVVQRATGAYRVEESRRSLFAVLDDLHKGRDCGPVWSVVIDAAAVLLAVLSATGLWLLCYLKKRRASGLVVGAVGALAVVALWAFGIA